MPKRGMDGCDGYRACIDDGGWPCLCLSPRGPTEAVAWRARRRRARSLASLSLATSEPNLTAARHLRARKLPLPFAPPPPTTTHPGDKGSIRLLRQEPNFLGARYAGGKRPGPHSGAAGPMGSGE